MPGASQSLGCLLLCAASLAAASPEPLLMLRFGGHLRNEGTLGGEARAEEYVAGEGMRYAPGPWGLCVDFSAAGRSGGRTREPAGGAVVHVDRRLGGLQRLTLVAWFRPADAGSPARLLYMPGEWDLMLANLRPSLKIVSEGKDHSLTPPPQSPSATRGAWNFVAVTLDAGARTAEMYLSPDGAAPRLVGSWSGLPTPDCGGEQVQIGNLDGVRPFRGRMDNVAVYDDVLTPQEVTALHRRDDAEQPTVADLPAPPQREAVTGLRHSDVCFSTRWDRDDAVEAIRAFGANRVLWVYTNSAQFVSAVHAVAQTVQGALNANHRTDDSGAYCVDLDGTKLVAPWMVTFNKTDPVKWGCNNQPAYREAVFAAARRTLDAGVDWVQFDDWALTAGAHSWGGGCMCDRCMAGFTEYLRTLPEDALHAAGIGDLQAFDYRAFLAHRHGISDAAAYREQRTDLPTTALLEDFQRRSVRSFFADLRREMDAHAGRRVPLSVNTNLQNPSQRHNFLADIPDFCLGETSSAEMEDLAICAATADALGKYQVVSPFPHTVPDTRMALAATYALGQLYLVPWDVWMGPEKDRHFGTPDQYGDLYGFVRGNQGLFDGFETPGLVGVVVDTNAYDAEWTRNVVRRLLRAQVPFHLLLSGDTFYHVPLAAERLHRYGMIVVPDRLSGLPRDDREALAQAADAVAVLPGRRVTDDLLRELAPITVWAPEGVFALLRHGKSGGERAWVCHILNRTRAAAGEPPVAMGHLALTLRRSALPGGDVAMASWHSPGQAPVPLKTETLPEAVRLVIPELAEWGVVRVDLAK